MASLLTGLSLLTLAFVLVPLWATLAVVGARRALAAWRELRRDVARLQGEVALLRAWRGREEARARGDGFFRK